GPPLSVIIRLREVRYEVAESRVVRGNPAPPPGGPYAPAVNCPQRLGLVPVGLVLVLGRPVDHPAGQVLAVEQVDPPALVVGASSRGEQHKGDGEAGHGVGSGGRDAGGVGGRPAGGTGR